MDSGPLANSPEVDALLEKMRAAHQGLLRYDYDSSVGIQVMMGGFGDESDAMEARFTRKGSVLQGGPLGTLVEIKKDLEIPGMAGMATGMSEEMRVLVRKNDLLFDIKPSEMAGMMGGPQGLARLSKEDLEEFDAMMPMPATMNFVMMQTPRYVNPLEVVSAVADQTGLDQIERLENGQIVLSGATPQGLIMSMGPEPADQGDSKVSLTLDGETMRCLSLRIGTAEKAAMELNLTGHAVPEALKPADFDLNPEGKEVGDYAAMLRAQLEAITTMGTGEGPADDEDEF